MNNGTFTSGTNTYTFSANAQAIGGANAIAFSGAVSIANSIVVTNQNTNVVQIVGNLTAVLEPRPVCGMLARRQP